MAKDKNSSASDKNNKDARLDSEKYKYHQSQINEDEDNKEKYPEKPKNHTTTSERLLDPDRGDK